MTIEEKVDFLTDFIIGNFSDEESDGIFEFIAAHVAGAKKGHCDGTGGMEFRRSLTEWLKAGMPKPVKDFLTGTRPDLFSKGKPCRS